MSPSLLATLQQCGTSLRWSFYLIQVKIHWQQLQREISDMQQFYQLQNSTRGIKDWDKHYPNEKENPQGVSLELKYVINPLFL